MQVKFITFIMMSIFLLGCADGASNCYGRPQDEECIIVWGGQLPSGRPVASAPESN